jgi:AcrR family transcriptional regulator
VAPVVNWNFNPMSTSETASRPLRADALRNRQLVLDGARVCFARDGINAQMDDIASLAGVGVGTVYRHFETKEALVQALAGEYFAGEAALAEKALSVEDPWEAFSGFMRQGAELLAENRALAQISADRPEVMREAALRADLELGFFGSLGTLIARAQDAGVLRADFQLEDIPAIMCSLGALQVSRGAYANWRRVLGFALDGLRSPSGAELPPVTEKLPRSSAV